MHCIIASGTFSLSVQFIKPPLISILSLLRGTSLFLIPSPIPSPALPSGHSTALPLASSPPIFGTSVMNVVIKHSQSPSSSITSLAGSSTLGQCDSVFLLTRPEWELALTEHYNRQSRSSLPFLAYNACETSCIDFTYDPRSSLCPTHSFRVWTS